MPFITYRPWAQGAEKLEVGLAGGSTMSFGPISLGLGSPGKISKRNIVARAAQVALTALDMQKCDLSIPQVTSGNFVVSTNSFTFDNVPPQCMHAIHKYEASPGLQGKDTEVGVYKAIGPNSAFIQPASNSRLMPQLHSLVGLSPEQIASLMMGSNGGGEKHYHLTVITGPGFKSLVQ
ncbi:hypothetical protein OQA88_8306 [Cercophora sp. LCS_1]